MKNLLNLMRKRGEKPIICAMLYKGEKPPKSSWKNGKKNQILILEEGVFRVLDQKLEHDIQI